MADALKAEGNKLFAEKKFEESMYVLGCPLILPFGCADGLSPVKNLPKP
jgi:hypothetical protein